MNSGKQKVAHKIVVSTLQDLGISCTDLSDPRNFAKAFNAIREGRGRTRDVKDDASIRSGRPAHMGRKMRSKW